MKILILLFLPLTAYSKEVALSFDDAPMPSSAFFTSEERTTTLIKKLKALNVPPVMIFANPCKREKTSEVITQLKKYKDAGHFIANHSCSHPRLDDVGFDEFSKDAKKADEFLTPLFTGQKYFRYPYLHEGREEKLRDPMRSWLKDKNYRNGMVSIDNDDYLFSSKINQARTKGREIDFKKVEKLFLNHVIGAANFYDDLAVRTIGRSPKHVILLHEMDATVMFIDSLVKELRKQGWSIISIAEAYKDPIYLEAPKNTYANNGIIPQIVYDRGGKKQAFDVFYALKAKLNEILSL